MKLAVPSFIRTDFLRKLVALIFAVLLWCLVRYQLDQTDTYRDVPVKVEYDANSMLVEKEMLTVNVVLRGSRQRLQKVRSADLRGTVRIPRVEKGVYFYDIVLRADNFAVPLGTTISEIKPDRDTLSVDVIDAKKGIPIRVRYSGNLREGYQITKCTLVPSTVDIRGPAKLLSEIKELVTEPVPLDETVKDSFEFKTRLVPMFSVMPSADTISVMVDVARQTLEQSYQELPLSILTAPDSSLQLADPLPPVTVRIQGPPAVIQSLDALAVRPFVELHGIVAPGRYRRPIRVWTAGMATVSVSHVYPTEVDVVLTPRTDVALPPPAKP